jgi:hypothetical protein
MERGKVVEWISSSVDSWSYDPKFPHAMEPLIVLPPAPARLPYYSLSVVCHGTSSHPPLHKLAFLFPFGIFFLLPS